MFAARGSSRRGWGAASALAVAAVLFAACQIVAAPPTVARSPGAATARPSAGLAPTGATQEATVTYIVDGDTIHVDIGGTEYRLRYIGINAPEIAHDNNPGQPFGPEATQADARLVGGQRVILETDTSDTDQFGRLLRYVWLHNADGSWLMVNRELVAQGMAVAKRYPPDTRYATLLEAAEADARAAGLGLWAP